MKKKGFLIILASCAVVAVVIMLSLNFYSNRKISYYTKNEAFSNQWGLYNCGQEIEGQKGTRGVDIDIIKAWDFTKGSPEVIVGILDSGVELDCVEIKDSIYQNPKESINGKDDDNNGFIDDKNGWNFFSDNNMVYDDYLHDYHGTYLASIIASSHDSGKVFGIAPNVKVLPLKFMHGARGNMKDSIQAIDYAYSFGVRIINCSWDSTVYDEDLKKAMEKYQDVLFVCSAGKSKNNLESLPVYPACYDLPNVISVVAVDNRGELEEFSGYGASADVAAPGVGIYGAMPDGGYIFSGGTSTATACVTGIAALIQSYYPELSATQTAQILKDNCKPLDSLKGKVASGGIINAYMCLKNAAKYVK